MHMCFYHIQMSVIQTPECRRGGVMMYVCLRKGWWVYARESRAGV